MKSEFVGNILKTLAIMSDKPSMFFVDAEVCEGFLTGVDFTLKHSPEMDIAQYDLLIEDVTRKHGWTWQANSFCAELRERGHSDAEIITRLIALKIDFLQQLLSEDSFL